MHALIDQSLIQAIHSHRHFTDRLQGIDSMQPGNVVSLYMGVSARCLVAPYGENEQVTPGGWVMMGCFFSF